MAKKTIEDFEVPKGFTLINNDSFIARIGKCEGCKLKAENKELKQSCEGHAEYARQRLKKLQKAEAENKELKQWQQKIRQLLVKAQNIGFCETKKGKHFKCSLDEIYEQAIKDK